MVKPVRIFTLYAKEDEPFVEQLTARLSLLRRKGIVQDYYDKEIGPSETWNQQSRSQFRSSDYLLFLVSPAFLNSGYYEDSDIQKSFSLAQDGSITIIPILIQQCHLSKDPLSQFRSIPLNGAPVESPIWGSEENAWKATMEGLKELITGEKPEIPFSTSNSFADAPATNRGMGWPMQLLLSIIVLASMAGITYYLVNLKPAKKSEELAVNSTPPDSNNIAPVTDPISAPVDSITKPAAETEKITSPKSDAPKTRGKRTVTKPVKDTTKKVIADTIEKKEPPPPPPKAPTIKSAELEKMLYDFSQGNGAESDFAPYLCNKLETTVRYEKKSMSFHEMCVAIKEVKAKKIKKISVVAASYEGPCISNLEVDLKKKLF